ncbi:MULTISPECIES: 2-hydroxyacid dehydrogenase [Rhizobium/Agrobacterium group]|uniref:2-hydroxyacid dehydrogenase n=1 Tax=Rhizobium rhizogenes TaxID=359 RepID=A0A546XG96_RHIRH|nr:MULTISPECIES: 2-hydroxyacid dehydrogenase [Rhizobium/Agrobacterium group]TRA99789.1 2-hydroxyacid dehydrogenase [Rhizobium rhizogenes]
MKPDLLQTYPLQPQIEAELQKRFRVHRWHEISDKQAFLQAEAASIKAVVTGGHIGVAPELATCLPALEIVAINGVGFDKVDLDQARERGFRVTNTPDVLTEDVADLAIGLSVMLLRQLVNADHHVRSGAWKRGEMPLGNKASRRRYGIYGLGRIGRAIAARLEAFNAEISYFSRQKQDVAYEYHPTAVSLASACDVLIVAAAATPETKHAINREVLEALGPDGVLVNVARGSLVDEKALVDILLAGGLKGAALDVFENEPHVPEALFGMRNVVLAPHIGAATHETRLEMGALVLANLDAHFAGRDLPTPVV